MERTTLIKLTKHYFKTQYPHAKTPENKPGWVERIEFALEELETKGFTPLEIFDKLTETAGKATEPDKLFTIEELARKKNLLKPGKEYFHGELKIFGDRDKVPYQWPTTKELYSIEDLLKFFYEECHVERRTPDRDRKILERLLTEYTVDEILFTISGVIVAEYKQPIYSAGIINRFIERGLEYYQYCKDIQLESRYQWELDNRKEREQDGN
jgi:hypothetical protein